MQKAEVNTALTQIAEARAAWVKINNEFNSNVDRLMTRLLNEAAANRMSVEEVARASGLTVKRVRVLMRNRGLNPKDGKNLLAKKAAETLESNANLLGIEPGDMDLMSPLTYLPAGSQLRAFLETPDNDLSDYGLKDVTGQQVRVFEQREANQ